jgi:hypothetical protein
MTCLTPSARPEIDVIATLSASVVVLTALTVLNLVLCLAVIRRLRAAEESAASASLSEGMPAPGTVVSGLTATTTNGVVIGPDDLAHEENFVGVLSVGCPSCETFAAEVDRGRRSLPEHALLIIAAGAGDDPGQMAVRLSSRARVIVTADDGPELSAFGGISTFPTFMRLERGVVVASHFRADAVLRTFRSPLTGAGR